MVTLLWIPDWEAYAVRRDGRMIGMVRFVWPSPFKVVVEIS